MKKILIPSLAALLCTASSLFAQTTPAGAPPNTAPLGQHIAPSREEERGNNVVHHSSIYIAPAREDELYTFDLDFPGGTPADLVKAIKMRPGAHRDGETTQNIPLNVIIPSDCKSVVLPAIRVENVTAADLFAALGKTANKESAGLYKFTCEGAPRNNSVWTFWSPPLDSSLNQRQPSECRFYELAPFLETYKVEDITTVVETAWKMLGETSIPRMEFHKETKLLIVVGHPNQLQVINDALRQLSGGPAPAPMSPAMIKRYHLQPPGATTAPESDADQRFFDRYHMPPRKPSSQSTETNDAPAVKP